MQRSQMTRTAIAAALIAAGIGGYATFDSSILRHALAAPVAAVPAPGTGSAAAAAALPDFTGIVAQNGPAVVNISTTGKSEKVQFAPGTQGVDPSDPFFQFFRQFNTPIPHGGMPMHGVGSGFIVSPEGLILTNAHVVAGAKDVTVKLIDKREFTARVIGIDKPSDVAVLKIEAKNLPVVKMQTADNVRIGEWVLAIGSPFGFENSVTSGIVSAKARSLPGDTYVPFLQTDVAVNPGNSGGPLFNLKGEVIGINSQIYTRSGGYQGVSFAIPIQVALRVKDQLVSTGHVTRGRIGVSIQDVNQGLADSFGLKEPGGALVSSVDKSGPAAKAGIEPGDVIVRYNGTKVTSSSQLPVLVADTAPGVATDVQVVRNGSTRNMSVTVGELEQAKVAAADTAAAGQGRLGLAVRPLTRDERKASGISHGLVVENATGPAATAGIEAGDVILSFNNTPVTSSAQLSELVAKSGKHVALLVQREDGKIFVPIDLG